MLINEWQLFPSPISFEYKADCVNYVNYVNYDSKQLHYVPILKLVFYI